MRLCLVTGDSIAIATESPSGWTLEETAPECGAQCLAVDPIDPYRVYAGTGGDGVLRSTDAGRSWVPAASFRLKEIFSLAVSPSDRPNENGVVYAGTEPSALFRSEDGGGTWHELVTLQEIPSKPLWSFPPRPHTHHVRWIALSAHDPGLILAGIELGGVMRSTDTGRTWEDHRHGAYHDCHALAMHPTAPGRAYEAAGGGAAVSLNAGDSWHHADEGLTRRYAWALAVDPHDPEIIYLSASPSPMHAHYGDHADAAIYRRRNGRWEEVGDALAPPLAVLPMAITTDADGAIYAGLRDGTLYRSRDKGDSWERLPTPALRSILALAVTDG